LSVLTKLFVVLLVVCSLLLSAATVVFVNRVDAFGTQLTAANAKLKSKAAEAADLTTALNDSRSANQSIQNELTAERGKATTEANAKDAEVLNLKAAVAELNKEKQVSTASVKGMEDLARATQEENKALQGLLADLRTKNDSLLQQKGELETALSKSTNDNMALDKSLRYAQEQITELKGHAAAAPAGGGAGAGGAADATTAAASSNADIKGVVRKVDVIGGKKYATISVGSADNVAKGMKFNVINRSTGEFLGYLTVQTVEPNEAMGQLEGKVDKVQPNVEVRTQL
jgi:hypothetical protein